MLASFNTFPRVQEMWGWLMPTRLSHGRCAGQRSGLLGSLSLSLSLSQSVVLVPTPQLCFTCCQCVLLVCVVAVAVAPVRIFHWCRWVSVVDL